MAFPRARTTAAEELVYVDGQATPAPEREDNVVLLAYWRSIRKRLKEIIALTAVATLVGVAVAYSMTEIFRATSSIMIEPLGKQGRVEESGVVTPFDDNLQTQLQVLKSRSVVRAVIRDTRLWEDPEFDPRAPKKAAWYSPALQMLGIQKKEQVSTREWTEDSLIDSLIGRVTGLGSMTIIPNSRLINVSFDSQNPQLAARVANAWVQAFLNEERESRLSTTQSLNTWLTERARDLQQNLSEAERRVQEFREKNNLVNVGGAAQALSTRQMEELMPKFFEAQSKVTQLETAQAQVKTIKDGNYFSVPWVMSYGGVPAAREKEDALRAKIAELSVTLGPDHPRMRQARDQLREADENLRRQIEIAVSSLGREYQIARAVEKSMREALERERAKVSAINKVEFQLSVLEREVAVNRQLYDAFMARGKQIDATSEIERPFARVIDPAVPNYSPIAPNKERVIAMFFAISLLVGIALTLLLDWLDNTIKGPEDAERKLGLPTLTALPDLKRNQDDGLLDLFSREPGGLYAESIRSARTGLLLSALDDPTRVFMVTSAMPGEGKTTTATNLAVALAQNKRTLLIEADMRRPKLEKELGLGDHVKGLANLVAGNATADECMHRISGSSLVVMPTGDIPPNPLELLSSHRFEQTIEELKQQFDFVVIDTPPVQLVSDALAISRIASATLFVVRSHSTPLPVLTQAIKRLDRVDAKLLGVILNAVDFQKAHKYYGEYSSYAGLDYKGYAYIDGEKVYGARRGTYGYIKGSASGASSAKSADMPATGRD